MTRFMSLGKNRKCILISWVSKFVLNKLPAVSKQSALENIQRAARGFFFNLKQRAALVMIQPCGSGGSAPFNNSSACVRQRREQLAVLAWLCYMSKAENNLSGHGAHCLERSKHPIVPLAAAYVTKSNIEVQLRIGRSGVGGSNVQETLHKNVCMQCRPIFRPKYNLLAN